VSLLAWPLTLLALVFMFPWARWLLNRQRTTSPVLLALTTLGLSVGTLSQIMLWIGLSGLRIDWRFATVIAAVVSAMGWLVWVREKSKSPVSGIGVAGWWRGAVAIIAVMAGLIVFNAIYWPFGIDDAITIYATFGKQITLTGQLPRGPLYEMYPMLVPLLYAFTHQAAGWINEHLAALIPALLSVGILGVAYLLGEWLFERVVGITAALLVALTPMFTHWASAGYVDLPTGFFYGLTALFLLRLERSNAWPDALLSGIMAGLAAWTKNSGLLVILSIALWLGYRALIRRTLPARNAILIAAAYLIVAGPWYARNLALSGALLPPTGWIARAERTVVNLFPYLVDTRYSVIGWLFTAGMAWALWQAWRSRGRADAPVFLLIFHLPFFAIWWALFSYDGRFLLVLTPFAAVMGAQALREIARRLPQIRYMRAITVALVVVLALPAASAAVDYKPELLRRPLMSEADKHRLRLGADRYDMALFLSTLPAGSRIWTQDLLLPYHADGVEMVVGNWPAPDQLAAFDYWVVSPGEPSVMDCAIAPLHVQGGYTLYRVSDLVQNGQWACRFTGLTP